MAKDRSKQPERSLNRRDLLKVIGAVPVAALVPATSRDEDTHGSQTPSRVRAKQEPSVVSENAPVIVINPGDRLLIDTEKGTLASFCSTYGVDLEGAPRDYAEAIWSYPDLQLWYDAAKNEPWIISDFEV